MKPSMVVTGGYGFVGTAFVSQARSAYDVTCVARRRSATTDVVWDLTNARLPELPDADRVVHIASLIAKEAADETTLDEYRRANVDGTRNLLAALPSPPAYVLYVSTADVYGHGRDEPITESTSPRPQTPYAESKLEAELEVTGFCTTHGIPYGIARLGSVYGPGEAAYRKVIPTFIALAVAGDALPLMGKGTARRHFLYVDDAARALLLMAQSSFRGVLNVVGSTVVSTREVADLIVELSGQTAGIAEAPSNRPEVDILFDATRFAESGFVHAVDLREGLQREIDWHRGVGHAPGLRH